MCGIAGIISNNKIDDREARINNMCAAMLHRGPDANGMKTIDTNCVLGHIRLSIIDLHENSNQPMADVSGRYIVSYNGEIVNYQEIKAKLQYPFQTKSDTEVILAAVSEKSLDWLLEQAVGMYAFILYDKKEKKTFLARDRFGIKPLLYCIQDNTLIIASEIQGLLSSGLIPTLLNTSAIDEYLGYRYVREPYTFFQKIFQVPHASYLMFDEALHMTSKQYYTLSNLNFDTEYDESILLDELDDILIKTTNQWLVSDVNIGSYLSGGVDSSLLTAYIAKQHKNLDTYTIGFNDEETNEFPYAQIVADLYQTKHRAFTVTLEEYLLEDDNLPLYKGAPLGVPNESLLSIMTANLAKDVTVVISGEGADELFAGYGRIFRSPFDYKNHTIFDDFFTYFLTNYEYIPRIFRDTYIKYDKPYRSYFDTIIYDEFQKYKNEENVFRFFHEYHIQGLLQRLDACTMRSSIESRPPFLDHKLVDFIYNKIPYELKLHWNNIKAMNRASGLYATEYSEVLDTPKYLLKKMAGQYLPKNIIYRKKQGFPVPLTTNISVLQNQLKLLKECDWIFIKDEKKFIDDINQLPGSGQILWMLLNIEKFKRIFFTREWRY